MDIDDEPPLAHDEDSMMLVDSSQPGAPAAAVGEDAMMSDTAADGDEREGDAEMSDAHAEGDVEGDDDEVMLVEEHEHEAPGGEGAAESLLESARMSPVEPDAVPATLATGAAFDGGSATTAFSAPTPTATTDMQDGTTSAQALSDSNTAAAWPPAPTDIPAVPSRLPDALSVVESTQRLTGELGRGVGADAAVDAAVDTGAQGGDGMAQVESASVKAEPAASVAPSEVGGAGSVIGLQDASGNAEAAQNGADDAGDDEPDLEEHDAEEDDQDEDGADFDEDTTEDLLPPMLLHFGTAIRPLFFPIPSDVDVDLPEAGAPAEASSSNATAALTHDPLLADRADDLLFVPLETFFAELRAAAGEDWAEDKGVDMVIEQKDVQLTICENDKQTTHLTLQDIVALHARLGCPVPLSLHVSARPENFFRRYQMIVKMLDDREMSEPGEDGEGEVGEDVEAEEDELQDGEDGEEGEEGEDDAEEQGELEGNEHAPGEGADNGQAELSAQDAVKGSVTERETGSEAVAASYVGASTERQAEPATASDAMTELQENQPTSVGDGQAADPQASEHPVETAAGTDVATQAEDAEDEEADPEEQDELGDGSGDAEGAAHDPKSAGADASHVNGEHGDVRAPPGATDAGIHGQDDERLGEEAEDALHEGEEEDAGGVDGEQEDEYEDEGAGEEHEDLEGEEEAYEEVDEHEHDAYGVDSTVAAAEREAGTIDDKAPSLNTASDAPSPKKRPHDGDDTGEDSQRSVKRKVSGTEEKNISGLDGTVN